MDKYFKVALFIFILFIQVAAASAQVFNKGDKAPDLKLASANGDSVELASLRGKLVLVEYWASWCGPCRIKNRNFVSLYNKYKDCGFEIVCISADENTIKWKNAINLDGLSCIHLRTAKGWYSKELKEWGVKFIPASFLLDREGRFIAVEPSYGVVNAWLEELL